MARLNDKAAVRDFQAEDDTPLLWVLREQLGLTGSKYGCGIAQCGACTVHIDGVPTRSCVRPVASLGANEKIVTTELTIKGNYVYDFQGFVDSLKLLEEKKIDIAPLMTNVYPLTDGVKAFSDLEKNADGKMLKVFLES